MASSSPSSTLDSSVSSESSTPLRDLSGPDILNQTRKLQSSGIHYAADENLASLCEFTFNKNIKGDMLINKNSDNKISEFICAGIFQIDPKSFFMTSDGKWNSNNPLGTRFDQVKPTCHILPVQRNDDFSFSAKDYPTIISNIRSIENLGNPRKSRDIFSTIVGDSSQPPAIKLTHHLFTVCSSFHNNIYISFISERRKKFRLLLPP